MKPITTLTTLALAAALGACGSQTDTKADGTTSGPSANAETSNTAPSSADPELIAALQCWGYTRASFYLHLSAPNLAADIPQAGQLDMEMWHQQALRLAHARDLTLSQFEALRDETAISNTDLLDDEERLAAAQPIQQCIDTVPVIEGETPMLREG